MYYISRVFSQLCWTQQSNAMDSRYFCRRCLSFCRREDSFKEHMERCEKHIPQKTYLPKKNDKKGRDKVRFTNIARQLPLPFYFVADFECILKKTEEEQEEQAATQNEKCCCGKDKPTVKCNNCKQWWYCSEVCKLRDCEEHKESCIEASKKTNVSSTKHVNEHVPCGAAYKISCTDPAFYRDPVIITHHEGEKVKAA